MNAGTGKLLARVCIHYMLLWVNLHAEDMFFLDESKSRPLPPPSTPFSPAPRNTYFLMMFDIFIILTCIMSLVLCTRSVLNGIQLQFVSQHIWSVHLHSHTPDPWEIINDLNPYPIKWIFKWAYCQNSAVHLFVSPCSTGVHRLLQGWRSWRCLLVRPLGVCQWLVHSDHHQRCTDHHRLYSQNNHPGQGNGRLSRRAWIHILHQ